MPNKESPKKRVADKAAEAGASAAPAEDAASQMEAHGKWGRMLEVVEPVSSPPGQKDQQFKLEVVTFSFFVWSPKLLEMLSSSLPRD